MTLILNNPLSRKLHVVFLTKNTPMKMRLGGVTRYYIPIIEDVSVEWIMNGGSIELFTLGEYTERHPAETGAAAQYQL